MAKPEYISLPPVDRRDWRMIPTIAFTIVASAIGGTMLGDYAGREMSEYRITEAGNPVDAQIGRIAIHGERTIARITGGYIAPPSGLDMPKSKESNRTP